MSSRHPLAESLSVVIDDTDYVPHTFMSGVKTKTPMGPLIAIDMDDVLCATNASIAKWHNENYGTDMSIEDFFYYHYWKNPDWGTPAETLAKVQLFYNSAAFLESPPVQGSIDGVKRLLEIGFRLAVVTARSTSQKEHTESWLNQWFPGCFEIVSYTGEFTVTKSPPGSPTQTQLAVKKITKPIVLHSLGARLLIDDSLNNAIACATANPPIRTLLFGKYQWNQRLSGAGTPLERMSHAERTSWEEDVAVNTGIRPGKWWTRDDMKTLPDTISRVDGWEEAVEWLVKRGIHKT